mgnify:CR=1 FL=1
MEVTLPGARRGERLMVAPIQKDGTFLLSGNIASGKLVFINFPKDYVRIPVYIEQKHYTLVESDISITFFQKNCHCKIDTWNSRKSLIN